MRTAVWFVTNECNFKCPYCWQDSEYRKAEAERALFGLTDEPWLSLCVEGLRKLNLDMLDLTGGEPLLRPVVALIKRLPGIKFAVTTNASQTTTVDSLLSLGNSRVVSMTFSRHPTQRNQNVDQFWRLVARSHCDARIATTVNFVGWPDQLEYASACERVCNRIGCRFHFDPYAPAQWHEERELLSWQKSMIEKYTTDHNRKAFDTSSHVRCSAGAEHFMISPTLDVYRCLDSFVHDPSSKICNLLECDVENKIKNVKAECFRGHCCAGCDRDKVRKTDL